MLSVKSSVARVTELRDLEPTHLLVLVGRQGARDRVGRGAVVRRQRAFRRRRRPQDREAGAQAVGRIVVHLAEGAVDRLLLLDGAGVAAGEDVVVAAAHVARRPRPEEEQLVAQDRAAERPADVVAVVGLLLVLEVVHRDVVGRVEHEALDRSRAGPGAGEVVVRFTAVRVAARLGHRADDAAERAAVLRADAAGLHLHFLQVLEHGVLTRRAVDQAVGDDAVDGEGVLGAAGAVDLDAAFDFARVHRGRGQREVLERAALRDAFEFFGRHVVRDRRVARVDERRFGRDADRPRSRRRSSARSRR